MPQVKFDEAIAFFRQKMPLPTEVWDQVINESQDWAFTLAGVEKASVLQSVFDLIAKVIEGRSQTLTTYEDFAQNFNAEMVAGGYGEQKPWRTKLVFKQNINTAYNAGRYRTQLDPQAVKRRPYLQYIHGHPIVPRPHHKALHLKIWRADDPIWNSIYPPDGYGCFLAGTKIATPSGWQNIESLNQGDLIINGDGDVEPIAEAHSRRYTGRIVRIEVKGVGKLFATENHRILTMRGWIRAGELIGSDQIVKLQKLISPISPGLNNFIADINNSQILRDDLMSMPRKRTFGDIARFYTQAKGRDNNINKSADLTLDRDMELVNYIKPHFSEKINDNLLILSWERFITRLINSRSQTILQSLLPNFRSKKGTAAFKLFRCYSDTSVSIFGFTESWMNIVFSLFERVQNFASLLFPAIIISPLQSYRLAYTSSGNTKRIKQLHQTSIRNPPLSSDRIYTKLLHKIKLSQSNINRHLFNCLDLPKHELPISGFEIKNLNFKLLAQFNKRSLADFPLLHQLGDRIHLFDIPQAQGFVDGAPLDSFDSLDDFIDGIGHNDFVANKITSLTSLQVDCPVYNLTVNTSHSYNTSIGIVHNCHCQVQSLSDRDMEREGLQLSDPITDTVTLRDRITGRTQDVPALVMPKSEFNNNYPPGAIVDDDTVIAPVAEPGFNHAPGSSQPEQREEILANAKSRLSPRLRRIIDE